MKIILASASPRRRELLTQMGLDFEVCPSGGEEVITKEIPSEVVMELAAQKAREVAGRICGESLHFVNSGKSDEILVIGADTIVVKDHQILGKPKDEADAVRMLSMLQGDEHQVYTGVCLVFIERNHQESSEEHVVFAEKENPAAGVSRKIHTFYEKTDVHFNSMTEQEIWDYVKTGDPLDKAGAYGIQGVCGKYIRGIDGDYHNVVGLPIARLYQEMKKFMS